MLLISIRYNVRSMYLGCRFYPFVYVEFSRIPLEKSGLHIFPCTINCQTRATEPLGNCRFGAMAGPVNSSIPTERERRIRLFVSSTFEDMHGEREELVKFVFPQF